MDFSSADISTFKKLYEKHFGLKIDDKTANLKLAMLVRQFEIVYRPLYKKQLDKNEDEYNEQYKKLLSA